MNLRADIRRHLSMLGEAFVVVVAVFVALAPKLDEWGAIQPLLDAIS